jgi:hypothetical protein
MATYELPEHTTHTDGDTVVVLVFTEPLDANAERQVHRHLRAIHKGAAIATTGTNLVTVTPVPRTARPKKST